MILTSIKVDIVKGYEKVNARTFPAKNDNPARAVYSQDAYFHLGGAFPVKATIPVDKPSAVYPVGEYILNPDCFGTNEYDQLKFNGFNAELLNKDGTPVSKQPGALKNPHFVAPDSAM